MQLLIVNATCVNADGSFEADIAVDGGVIRALGRGLSFPAERVIDAQGKLVLPGTIDVHCHMPWPFGTVISGDDFASGTLAAACGGVTTVLDFVIPELGQSLTEALETKLAVSQGQAHVDYGFHIVVREANEANLDQVRHLVERGFPSFKVFMAYAGFCLGDKELLALLDRAAKSGAVVGVHAEGEALAQFHTQRLLNQGHRAIRYYPDSRPRICEVDAIGRIIAYARHLGVRLHIHHVSSREGVELIGKVRAEGMALSAETCPHYLVFTEEAYHQEGPQATYFVCSPPIRASEDREALWEGLAKGALTMVATDHCPYTVAQKTANPADFTVVPGGVAGVEMRLPILYTEGVGKGRFSLNRLVALAATNPARAFGLYPRKGVIAVGSDADLVILDPTRRSTLRAEALHMNTDHILYEGMPVEGFPLTTILRGRVLVEEGVFVGGKPSGELIRRTLPTD